MFSLHVYLYLLQNLVVLHLGNFVFMSFIAFIFECRKNIKLHSNCSRSVTLPNRDLLTFVTVMETLFLDNHIERIM